MCCIGCGPLRDAACRGAPQHHCRARPSDLGLSGKTARQLQGDGDSERLHSLTAPIVLLATINAAQRTLLRLAICVPLIILVISKKLRKRKYTISKTISCAQSWICVEIQDVDFMCVEICFRKPRFGPP